MADGREPARLAGVHSSGGEEEGGSERDAAETLEAIRRGDADAFDRMARQESPRLYRFALHLTGRPEEAEDLVQETLVRALTSLRRFEGRAALSTYLIRALGNLWKNRLRARSRSRFVEWFRGNALDPPDRAPSAFDLLSAEDRAEQVRRAVARLDPQRRITLLLRELEGLSYEEIATMTAVPVGTVRSRLARARQDLRQWLGGPR
ncbi:MAG: RNA polymerase subunit sigma-70 [Acidobacteria bacterium]|nr:MAG: RNA polymerase subunit sigma-70 [Acidobacteriota bacterium]